MFAAAVICAACGDDDEISQVEVWKTLLPGFLSKMSI